MGLGPNKKFLFFNQPLAEKKKSRTRSEGGI